MSQMDRIEQMCKQILTKLGEAPSVTSGVTYDADGIAFLPGSGRLGGSGTHDHERDDEPATDDPDERARILAEVRATRPTRTDDEPQTA